MCTKVAMMKIATCFVFYLNSFNFQTTLDIFIYFLFFENDFIILSLTVATAHLNTPHWI